MSRFLRRFSVQITMDRYGHIAPDMHHDAASLMDRIVGQERQEAT